MNAFLEDQLGAAANEAAMRARRAAVLMGEGTPVAESPAGPFTTALLDECLRRIETRTQQVCRHLRAPGISWLLSWRPDRLLCDGCAVAVSTLALGPDQPQVCSICTQTVDRLGSFLVVAGPLMVMVATCQPCYATEFEGAS